MTWGADSLSGNLLRMPPSISGSLESLRCTPETGSKDPFFVDPSPFWPYNFFMDNVSESLERDSGPTAVVLIGHGSPLAEGNRHFRETVAKLMPRLPPEWMVREAFLEHAEPEVRTVLHELARMKASIHLFPFLLFDAGHSKGDVWGFMGELAREFPKVTVVREWAIGTDQAPVSVILKLLPPKDPAIRDQVVIVGRGSLDPGANASLYYQGRRLWERRQGGEFLYSFIGVTEPRYRPLMETLEPSGFDRILVVPYFLFEGVLMERIRKGLEDFLARHPLPHGGFITPPFGDHPVLLDAIAGRLTRLVKNRQTVMPRWLALDPPASATL